MKRFAEWAINYKRRISSSLTAKTFILLLALLIVICLVTYIFIGVFLPFANEGQTRRDLDDKSVVLVSELRQRSSSESGSLFVRFIQETGADLYMMDESRESIDLFTFSKINDNITSGQEYPFRFADSDKEYILTVSYNPARSKEVSDAIWHSLPWAGGVVLILSFISALIFSRYTTRPMIRMSKTAANIANLDFSWYCPDLREDEIGTLAKSLNELSDKLSEALSALRRQNLSLEDEIALEKEQERRRLLFFSGVSHELKTPIAIVIGQLEGMQAGIGVYKDRDRYIARSAEILRSLDSFIKEILTISHMDIADTRSLHPTNLSDVLESSLKDNRTLIEVRSINVESKIEKNVFILGDAGLLKKALGNIISNAAVYSSEGGLVSVQLVRTKNEARLEIINTPAHIDDEHLSRLFEAFYRIEKHTGSIAGQGSGLGLYITGMILDNHGAPHKIQNFGDGVKFTVAFNVN